jgi:hypothetical protein
MMNREVTDYIVDYHARLDNTIVLVQKGISQMFPGGDPNPYFGRDPQDAIASIYLLNGRERIATISFYYSDNGRGTTYDPDNSPPVGLAYSIDRFSDIIGILRHEKPVYVWAAKHGDKGVIANLRTGREPIGEEEGA